MKFEDKSDKVKANMNQAAVASVLSALMIIEADYKANSRVSPGGGGTRDSITKSDPRQNGDEVTGQVGGPDMNHIWEEFGTGEYAVNGDGRKGGWWYFDKKKQKWIFTYGKSPNPALRNAFRNNKNNVKKALQGEFTKHMGG